jgi:hypothetical protein
MKNHGSPKEPLKNPKEDDLRLSEFLLKTIGQNRVIQNEIMFVRKEIREAPFRRVTAIDALEEVHNFYIDASTDCTWERE